MLKGNAIEQLTQYIIFYRHYFEEKKTLNLNIFWYSLVSVQFV